MKIIIGIDDSPCSRMALRVVERFDWPAGTQFVVVSAVTPAETVYGVTDAGGASLVVSSMNEDLKRHEELVATAEDDLKKRGFKAVGRVVCAVPTDALIGAAKEEDADLVVVGSHGRTGLARLLMGSVASHVVSHAPCSVLVVKEPLPAQEARQHDEMAGHVSVSVIPGSA